MNGTKTEHDNLYGGCSTLVDIAKEDILSLHTTQTNTEIIREDISEYVAQLQLHMALQARNLVPNLTYSRDSRQQLLQETQANIEKLVSRQNF